jgi:hypothetical protein
MDIAGCWDCDEEKILTISTSATVLRARVFIFKTLSVCAMVMRECSVSIVATEIKGAAKE